MSPVSLPSVLFWIGFYIATKQIMDVQKDLLGWLEEATLFPQHVSKQSQQQGFFGDPLQLCFNDFIGNTGDAVQKNHERASDYNAFLDLDVSDILLENGWMDEKIDLSILDPAQEDWLSTANEAATGIVSPEDLQMESYVNQIFSTQDSLLPPDSNPKSQSNGLTNSITQQILLADSVSNASTSPEHDIFVEFGRQLPSSPSQSSCSSSSFTSGDVMSPTNFEPNSLEVIEEVCYSPVQCVIEVVVDEQGSSNSDVATGRDRAFSGGKDLSQLRKSRKSSRQSHSPYHPKKEKYERKKVQNKEAAARYRVKMKEQDKLLSDEVAELEVEQEKLQDKHDKLKSEITYLKSLMKELFQARGIIIKKE